MDLKFILRQYRDFHRKNEYELKEFTIKDGKKHPFALICPGGGYGAVCSFVEGEPFAKKLNKMGYSAFVLYYRVREKAKYPTPQQDVARALRDILDRADELNVEREGFSIWGSSAGGHLVGSFGTDVMGYKNYDLPKPATLVLVYPVVTMGELTHMDSKNFLLGEDASDELRKMGSVEQQITSDYPPTFVWCGSADDVVNPENSRMLDKALTEAGVEHEFIEYPGIGHGVGVAKGLICEEWLERAVRFWEKHM